MNLRGVTGRAILGAASGLLALGSAVLAGPAVEAASAQAYTLAAAPTAQCASATEAEAWRGRYGGAHVDVQHQYYCGPAHTYSPEWYAAHVTPHPEWYAVYETEPTTCVTYHFWYENRWYCYTGP